MGPVLAWALVVQGVGLLANTVGQFLLDQEILPWLSPWLVSLFAAVVVAIMETVKEQQDLGETAASHRGASQRLRRGTPAPLAGLLVVVLVGAGGFALTAGTRYAVGYVSGNETGPIFHNSILTAADGTSLDGDPFRSNWSGEVTPNGVRRGVVVFPGHLAAGTNRATFSFASVFGRPGGGAVTVRRLALHAP
jgi:hypothetical protein